MTTEEILQSLCYYDKRNPDCTADDEDIEDHKTQLLRVSKKLGYNKTCSCDNCFYGRTKLAEELLKAEALRKHAVSSSVCHCNNLPHGEIAISSRALQKPYGDLGQTDC
jgi:hypothetical protein